MSKKVGFETIEEAQARFNQIGNLLSRMMVSGLIMGTNGDVPEARKEVPNAVEAFSKDLTAALNGTLDEIESNPELLASIKATIEKMEMKDGASNNPN